MRTESNNAIYCMLMHDVAPGAARLYSPFATDNIKSAWNWIILLEFSAPQIQPKRFFIAQIKSQLADFSRKPNSRN